MKAYTYLIGWSHHSKYYYGVRYAKGCNTNELWKTYYTSSKYVKQFYEKYGEPDIIEVRQSFNDIEQARLHEHKVLRRLNVTNNDIWLNQTDNMSISLESSMYKHTPEICLKKSKSHKGKKHSEETKKKMSKTHKGLNTWSKGKKRPEHSKRMWGINNPNVKPIMYNGKYFPMVKDLKQHLKEDKKMSSWEIRKLISQIRGGE